MVELLNDALGIDIDPECPFDSYAHNTMTDYATFNEITGWEPEMEFKQGVKLVCELYRDR